MPGCGIEVKACRAPPLPGQHARDGRSNPLESASGNPWPNRTVAFPPRAVTAGARTRVSARSWISAARRSPRALHGAETPLDAQAARRGGDARAAESGPENALEQDHGRKREADDCEWNPRQPLEARADVRSPRDEYQEAREPAGPDDRCGGGHRRHRAQRGDRKTGARQIEHQCPPSIRHCVRIFTGAAGRSMAWPLQSHPL